MSEEEEAKFFDEAYNESLDNPNVDKKVNMGTTAPNCQPKHTLEYDSSSEEDDDDDDGGGEEELGGDGTEVKLEDCGNVKIQSPAAKSKQQNKKKSGESNGNKNSSSSKQKKKSGGAGGAKSKGGAKKDDAKERERKMGYVQMIKMGYQELVNAIIRPPRAEYKNESLGPPAFTFCGRRFTRTDFTLQTKRGLNLQCSHWEPVERTSDRIPCVIYMHGNSSARVEVIPQLSYLLCIGLAVFSFDFAGSGKSDGENVSLGYYEREDLMCVIAHLRATNVVSTIALWGRSMGAATALMHGDRDPSIACMILDSPFADLTQLCEEMVEKAREQGINVPNFVSSVAIRMIRGSVKRQANFDIKDISPISHAEKSFIPALFVAGEHDDFIHKRHSESIHAKYAGDKNIIIVEGDHNSPRPKFMFDSVSIFLQTCLQIPNSWALKVHPGMNLMAPPWFFPGSMGGGPAAHNALSPKKDIPTRSRSNIIHDADGGGRQAKHASSMPPEQPEVGMTLERQREIQASLFRMLGQADDEAVETTAPADGAGSSNKTMNSERTNESSTSGALEHSNTFPPKESDESTTTNSSTV